VSVLGRHVTRRYGLSRKPYLLVRGNRLPTSDQNPMSGPSGVIDRTYATRNACGCTSRNFKAGTLTGPEPTWPKSRYTALVGNLGQRGCSVLELGSCAGAKNSFTAPQTGLALIRFPAASSLRLRPWTGRSFGMHAQRVPGQHGTAFLGISPTERTRRLPKWSMSSTTLLAVYGYDQRLEHFD